MQIGEIKGVQNDARAVRKGIGFVDVHSPAREHSRNRGEQRGAVGGEQRQDKAVSRRGHLRPDRFLAEFAVHPEMRGDLLRRVHREIAPRESFEEPLDFLGRSSAAGARLDAPKQRDFVVRAQPVAVEGPAEVIRSGDK